MSYARANLSIALSLSGGRDWQHRIQVSIGTLQPRRLEARSQVTDEFEYTDYSSLVGGLLVSGIVSASLFFVTFSSYFLFSTTQGAPSSLKRSVFYDAEYLTIVMTKLCL